MLLDELANQFLKFVYQAIAEASSLMHQIFASDIFGNLTAILKGIGKFIIVGLETILKVFKFIIK